MAVSAALALEVHLPGHLSVDSVIALYEAQTRQAFSWTPTFQSALLAWLGGGMRAAAIHVVAIVAATAAAIWLLLPGRDRPWPHRMAAMLFAMNPLIWMMVGVVWRDVLLGTAVLLASAVLLRLRRRGVAARLPSALCHGGIALAIAVAALARPQGALLAAFVWAAYAAWLAMSSNPSQAPASRPARWVFGAAPFAFVLALGFAADVTIRPLPAGTKTMDGLGMVMAYDVAGILARSVPAASVGVPTLPEGLRSRMAAAYDPVRVDPLLATPGFREWIIDQRARGVLPVWQKAVMTDPGAYLQHRAEAASALLGVGDVRRCLPGYWGVAGLPEMLAALDLDEAMDARDRWLARQAAWLASTPWFWNASYLVVLTVLMPSLVKAARRDPVPALLGLGALTFTAAYLVTTVACDVRYLYPVATIATALALDRLASTARKGGSPQVATCDNPRPSSH